MLTPNEATALIVVCCLFAAFGIIGLGLSFMKPQTASELDTAEHAWWRTATVLGGTAPRRKRRRLDMPKLEMRNESERTDWRMVVGADGKHRYVEGDDLVTDDIMTAGVVNPSALVAVKGDFPGLDRLEVMSPHTDAYVTGINVIPPFTMGQAVIEGELNEGLPAELLPHWGKTCICDDCTTKRFVSNNLDAQTGEWMGATEVWSPMEQLSGVGDFVTDAEVLEGELVGVQTANVIEAPRLTAEELEDMRWAAEFARVDDILEDTLRGIERRLRKQFPGIERQFAIVDAKYHAARDAAESFVAAVTTATAEHAMVSA